MSCCLENVVGMANWKLLHQRDLNGVPQAVKHGEVTLEWLGEGVDLASQPILAGRLITGDNFTWQPGARHLIFEQHCSNSPLTPKPGLSATFAGSSSLLEAIARLNQPKSFWAR